MTRERLTEIFEETDNKWEGDNAFQGLQILSKYTTKLISGADHNIIYSVDIDEIVEDMTEEDAIALAELNWSINPDNECFSCYV